MQWAVAGRSAARTAVSLEFGRTLAPPLPPSSNNFTLGIMAFVAQKEREVISSRTKAALAAAKARGQRLGNPNGAASLRRAGKGTAAAL